MNMCFISIELVDKVVTVTYCMFIEHKYLQSYSVFFLVIKVNLN